MAAIEVVVCYDGNSGEYKAYEPTTDTLFITTSLGETFLKLSEFLNERGLIAGDLLSSQDITYHIDSPTFIAMVQSNANLLKRLNTAPSGFLMSSKNFGISPVSNNSGNISDKNKKYKSKKSGNFSKSSFNSANRKFGL